MGYIEPLDIMQGRVEFLIFTILIMGIAISLLLYKKHRLAGAICFLAPTPIYAYINLLSLRHCFPTILALPLTLLSILPYIVFAIFMLIKAKNIMFTIPSALIFIPHIMADLFESCIIMHTLGGSYVLHFWIFGYSVGNTLMCIFAFITLLISCLAVRKTKFFAYLPFVIYSSITLMLLCYYTYHCVLHDETIYGIKVMLPSMFIFSMALFCLGKHMASENPPARLNVEQTLKPVYTNYPPQNSGNNYRPQQTDMVQELGKYKNMLDSGLINEEEYEKMKKRLLGL